MDVKRGGRGSRELLVDVKRGGGGRGSRELLLKVKRGGGGQGSC